MGKYRTVVIDFPWPIDMATSPDSTRTGLKDSLPYHTMGLNEIEKFDINSFAADECLLFLWVTNGKIKGRSIMKIGLDIIERWEFRYESIITWVKNRPMSFWSPIMSTTEHIIFAWRGKQPIDRLAKMKSVFEAEWRGHSVKPKEFYEKLAEWTPEPRIDIFARQKHDGFLGWGDEYEGVLKPDITQE